ncbi:MAG TPA: prepilin-type N-terminal cleavage/methylation domain-containing protein [Rubrobacteraceae bacterium]|nr:prepilin-type N-terminal cleavage/methylation domain-containing protein [Rubrobacteraceae bacterium]
MLRLKSMAFRSDEGGFTLPEALTTIAILGVLLAIGIMSWLSILERRRVDAATNQLVADLRLAHTNATNQLTDWRVVLVPEKADGLTFQYLDRNGNATTTESQIARVRVKLEVEIDRGSFGKRTQTLTTDVALRNRGS